MRSVTYVAAVVMLLAGCGGGGGGDGIPAGIDLIVQSVVAPEHCDWADTFNVDVVLTNRGKTASTNTWSVEVRLSTDQTIDATDTLLLTYTVSGLAALTDLPKTDSVLMPASGTDGVYFLGYIVDASNVEAEDIETNNTGYTMIYVGAAVNPDFEASNFVASANQVSGQSFGMSVDIVNRAVPYSGAVPVCMYLSTDSIINPASDTLIGSTSVMNMPYDVPITKSVSCVVAWTTNLGDYYVGVYVDPSNIIAEENESNNTVAAQAIHIERGPDQYEPNNSKPYATTLVINGPVLTLDFYPATEHDWFKFDIPVDFTDITIYIVDYSGDGTNPDATVYGVDGMSMGTFAGPGDEILWGTLLEGTHHIDVAQCLMTGIPVPGGRYQIWITSP